MSIEQKLVPQISMNQDALNIGNQDNYYLFNLSLTSSLTTLGSARVEISPN